MIKVFTASIVHTYFAAHDGHVVLRCNLSVPSRHSLAVITTAYKT